MNTERIIFLMLVFAAAAGCYNLDTDNFPTEKPDISAIQGTYRLNESSVQTVKQAGYEQVDATLNLLDDGTFTMTDVPDWWQTFGKSHGGYDSGQGTWKIQKHQNWWNIGLKFDSRRNFHSKPNEEGFSTSIVIFGKHPPFFLWLYVGDPDAGRAMVFEWRQPPSLPSEH
jgi:hypothetical protein